MMEGDIGGEGDVERASIGTRGGLLNSLSQYLLIALY